MSVDRLVPMCQSAVRWWATSWRHETTLFGVSILPAVHKLKWKHLSASISSSYSSFGIRFPSVLL